MSVPKTFRDSENVTGCGATRGRLRSGQCAWAQRKPAAVAVMSCTLLEPVDVSAGSPIGRAEEGIGQEWTAPLRVAKRSSAVTSRGCDRNTESLRRATSLPESGTRFRATCVSLLYEVVEPKILRSLLLLSALRPLVFCLLEGRGRDRVFQGAIAVIAMCGPLVSAFFLF